MTSLSSIWPEGRIARAGGWPGALRLGGVVVALALLAYVVVSGSYLLTPLGFALIYAVFVAGLSLFMGFAGQVSFGQSAFAAIGGYGSAVLTTTYGWEPLAAFLASALAAAVVALLIGFPTLRLRGHYLAMATLAIGLMSTELSVQWESVTQGYLGISGIPPFGILGLEAGTDRQQFLVLVVAVGLSLWALQRLLRSRFGRSLNAVAGSEDAAAALGVNVMRAKLAAFILAAVFASASGSLLAHFVGYVSPEMFGLHMVVLGFTMLYVGGIGTISGPLVGAVVIGMLPEAIRWLKDYQDLVYGVSLIVILIYAPKGLVMVGSRRRP
jgi:branched-chain amino acid transport system permease protein